MKKFILGLLVVLLITLNVVYIYNYEVVNKKLIEANQEKENLERVVEEKEKEKLSEEYLNNKQSLEVLLKQRENLEKQVSEYMEIMQYKPYFEGNKEFLTEKDQYHYNFFKMIEVAEEIEFDIFGTRMKMSNLKELVTLSTIQ